MTTLTDLSLRQLAERYQAQSLSPVEVLDTSLERINATEKDIGAYVCVLEDSARKQAQQAEKDINAGHWKGPLHGVPVALKDICDMQGIATTASSRVRENWIAQADAAIVAKLRAAGAVIIGKTHTHEFACGSFTPTTRNPWDHTRIPGGSSGGSAAAVASGSAIIAIGTDTVGSIRIPAAVCGVTGLKPTFGRISRAGITPLSWSLDQVGPITRHVEDAAICLQLLAGVDTNDKSTLNEAFSAPNLQSPSIAGKRIGIPSSYFNDHVDADTAAAVASACHKLQELGATLVEIDFPSPEQFGPVGFTILLSEAGEYHQKTLQQTPQLYTDGVRLLLQAGQLISAGDYIKALRTRTQLQSAVRHLFNQVDAIATPTVPIPATTAGQEMIHWGEGDDESANLAFTRFVIHANVIGCSALSLPCGLSTDGLPISLQLLGRPLEEDTILQLGAAYQAVTDWHRQYPGCT